MTNDLISREALAEKFKKAKNYAQSELLRIILGDVVDAIEEAPAVDAAPVVHGRWIHCDGKSNLWYCSECGGRIMYSQKCRTYQINKPRVGEANKFCKHCGAKMDKEE